MTVDADLLGSSFCAKLEFRVSAALSQSRDPAWRWLWCDGVLPPEADDAVVRKALHDRRIGVVAFVGHTGQDRWTLTLHLGDRSVGRLARGLDLVECIPDADEEAWLVLRPDEHEIDVFLR